MHKLVLYYNEKFEEKAKRLASKGRLYFGEVIEYKEEYFKQTSFYNRYSYIAQEERGAGYWIWKPYILLDSITRSTDGDEILYLDCGDDFNFDIKKTLSQCLRDSDICLTAGSFKSSKYTKRDCFEMMECDERKYWDSIQIEAGVIAFRANQNSKRIFKEWLSYCCDENILTDIPNICGKPNFPDFIDHRHDQSILSNLAISLNLKISQEIRKSVVCNVND